MAAVLIVAAIAAHGAIEAMVVRSIADRAGYTLSFDGVTLGLHGADFTNLAVSRGADDAFFTADRAHAELAWSDALAGPAREFGIGAIDATGAKLAIDRDAAGDDAIILPHPFRFHLNDGAIVVSRKVEGETRKTELAGITGTLETTSDGSLTYEGDAAVLVGTQRYPIEASAGVVHADALPAAAFDALAPATAVVHPTDGTLRDFTWHLAMSGTLSSGEAHLTGGTFSVDGSARKIAGAHGLLQFSDREISTPKLEAMLGGSPLHVAGVIREERCNGYRWATGDCPDLGRIRDLFARVARQSTVGEVTFQALAPGVAFAQVASRIKEGPVVYQIISVDPSDPTVRIGSALAQDRIVSGGERTSAMAERVGALAGVNGDYYDIGRTWEPQGIFVRDGRLLRTPVERYALAVHRDHHITFQIYRFHGTVRTAHAIFPLSQINNWPARDATLLTPEFGSVVPEAGMMYMRIEPLSANRYRVIDAPPDGVRVPASYGLLLGDRALEHGSAPRPGETIAITYDTEPSIRDVVAAVGGGPLLVKDHQWFEDAHAPAPDERDVNWSVVGVGKLPESYYFFAVDGRHPKRSVGMTRPEFGGLMLDYDVSDGFAFDSGGSATMVSKLPAGKEIVVRNVPSDDDGERWISDGLFIFSDAPRADTLAHE